MKVTPLTEAAPRPRQVAVGTFDGVHLGHREVIRGSDTVLTFDPHPLQVIHPGAAPKLLDSFALKRDLIASLGVEELVVVPFDRDFAARTHQQFVDAVLVAGLEATHVSVGENFRFGRAARGDADYLRSRPEFETRVVPIVEVEGRRCPRATSAPSWPQATSSRRLAPRGAVHARGEVVEGDRRGRELGMPTANLVPGDRLAYPGHGVYAATVHGRPAAVNVGVRPTFESGRGVVIEAHLIDFDDDLYGQTIRISFLARLRGERRFDSVEALVDQMHADVEEARMICAAAASVSRP